VGPAKALALLALALAGPARAAGKTALDVHCHLACLPTEKNECYVSSALLHSWKYKVYLKFLGVTEKEMRDTESRVVADRVSAQIAASSEVAKAVVLALDGAVKNGVLDKEASEVYIPNEFVWAEVQRHPNLLFGASVNPYRSDALERLRWAKEHGAVLIKWIPSVMGIDPADPALAPFYRKLVEYKLPLLVHTGAERTFTRSKDELCDPARLAYPLSLGVTVIAAHLASTGSTDGEKNFARLLPLFSKYPRLYADISATTQFNRIGFLKKALKEKSLHGRLVYGTDWPLQSFPIVSPWYHLGTIGAGDVMEVKRIKNVWDRDVALKRAMGMPEEILQEGWGVLSLKP
jgi:predicted TIM-barrel fold metal-dependent hydrolase